MAKNELEVGLAALRQRIDEIDRNIQALIVERAEKVLSIGAIKKQSLDEPIFYRPEREALLLKNVMNRNCGPLAKEEMAKIFRSLVSACLALQHPLNIAFLGPLGTFSEMAVLQHFGCSVNLIPANSIYEVFAKVEAAELRAANFGVVPIENSIGGVVNATIDAFIDSNLQICGEVNVLIQQNLLVNFENQGDIQRIYAHEQSLSQCQQWLSKNYPTAEQIPVSSSAHAAKLAVADKTAGALASKAAAEKYQLKILAKSIQDISSNYTRFLVIGHQLSPPSGDDRTSLLVTIDNSPGALEHLIKPFSQNKLNLTLIQSRRFLSEQDRYIFFLDADVHQDEPLFKMAMQKLKNEQMLVKILGSYPKSLAG